MFGGIFEFLAVVALIVAALGYRRIGRLEAELSSLRRKMLPQEGSADQAAPETSDVSQARPAASATDAALQEVENKATPEPGATGPWSRASEAEKPAETSAPEPKPGRKSDGIETAIGTRWAVWVGGIALALGGLFLVRYSIEAGIFGPGARLTMAGLLGLGLVAAGEFVRRTGFNVPIKGSAGAYVPGILTAAGAFTLFAAIYAAHGVYGFIGPALAFVMLGLVGVVTIAAALVHGQALAGLGLLGAMVTPALVSSQSPSAWALFGYLAIVLVANTAIARLREWSFTASAGFAGAGTWCLLYMQAAPDVSLAVILFINTAILACCALLWLSSREHDASKWDRGAMSAATFVALAAAQLLIGPAFQLANSPICGGALLAAMILVAAFRVPALPMLHAAGAAVLLASLRTAFVGIFAFRFAGQELVLEGFPPLPFAGALQPVMMALALLFLALGCWLAVRTVSTAPNRAAQWSGWAAAVPLVTLIAHWITFGDIETDFPHALAALALLVLCIGAAEMIARHEVPPFDGATAVSLMLAGAAASTVLMLHMAFGPLWTTILVGMTAAVPALATRWRGFPVLGWICVAMAVVAVARVAMNPTLVGVGALGTTPVFNALLPGYGLPAAAFAFAAWQLARTTGGRPRLAMEAAASLFALLTAGMLVRHAMHGGVIASGAPMLAEQAIYTLIALGAGAILLAIDTRSPSSVLRWGSIAAGVFSVMLIVVQHFFVLNPLITNESTGSIPLFNLLLLAYLLPAVAAAGLALYALGKRPFWYSAMLAILSASLIFTYATLSVRRLFQGEHIGLGAGMSQIETYSYSALWLAMGAAVLIAGVLTKSRLLRAASAVLISMAVAKVFIFDMSELEGVLRALSFIGLGAVLIGIGVFYQKLLTRTANRQAGNA